MMKVEIIGDTTGIETIAVGSRIHVTLSTCTRGMAQAAGAACLHLALALAAKTLLACTALQCKYYNIIYGKTALRVGRDESVANQNKHGVPFEEAKTVFADEPARLISDPDHSAGEERFILLEMSRKFRLLIVSHCERSLDLIRIISARKANRQERSQYEDFINA